MVESLQRLVPCFDRCVLDEERLRMCLRAINVAYLVICLIGLLDPLQIFDDPRQLPPFGSEITRIVYRRGKRKQRLVESRTPRVKTGKIVGRTPLNLPVVHLDESTALHR